MFQTILLKFVAHPSLTGCKNDLKGSSNYLIFFSIQLFLIMSSYAGISFFVSLIVTEQWFGGFGFGFFSKCILHHFIVECVLSFRFRRGNTGNALVN